VLHVTRGSQLAGYINARQTNGPIINVAGCNIADWVITLLGRSVYQASGFRKGQHGRPGDDSSDVAKEFAPRNLVSQPTLNTLFNYRKWIHGPASSFPKSWAIKPRIFEGSRCGCFFLDSLELCSEPRVDAREFFPNLTSICPEKIGWEGSKYRIGGTGLGGRGTCFVVEVLPVSLLSVVMA
jgi:hypothetical protein